MSLEIGVVGLPNVGKSTLFNSLTKSEILAANYPFATIDPNVGIVKVEDHRLDKLAQLYDTQNIVPATVKFIDIAGLVKGASTGEGLGNQFLAHIRECNAICMVVRAFVNDNVIRQEGSSSPENDIEVIETELILADLQTVSKRLPAIEKQAKANPKLNKQLDNLKLAKESLDKGELLSKVKAIDQSELAELSLLTLKPIIYVFNVDEQTLSDKDAQVKLKDLVSPSPTVFVDADLEYQLNSFSKDEANELLTSYGQTTTGLKKLVEEAYSILNLQSFLTAGPSEVRAWTIKKGETAYDAAGVIHTDFQRGFIAADIVNYDDLIKSGSIAKARSEGLVRTEGKTYVMQNDDIVEFKFNV
ncbi:MAG TPA: redox-regulated ATPase YchF [Candidatus Saccharimonadales bacterium]|nr:redox-regulated ATPase YchF [Candidatus Saccharimonadales bacterium]